MISCRGLFWVAFLLLPFASRSPAAETPADGESIYTPPLASIVEYANSHDIPLEGIELANRAEEAKPGDSVVLLVTFFDGDNYQQWLISLQTEELSETERERKPPNDIVLYTITGQVLRYPGSWSAIGVRTVGPFSSDADPDDAPPPHDRHSHALVRTSYLNLGFDRSCLFIMRTRSKLKHPGQDGGGRIDPGGVLSWGAKPFPEEKIEEGRKLAAEIGMTPEDDSEIGGVSPALAAFLRTVAKVPGLPEMAMRVVSIPSLWSFFREGGMEAGIVLQSAKVGEITPNRWGLPIPVYRLPFELRINERPALECSMIVAEPRRPLLTCAGILGLAASNPENKEKRLTVRLLATRATP